MRYAWVITKSFIEDEIPMDDWGKLTKGVPVDVAGPHGATADDFANARKHGVPFRIYDDDGILYYAGRCWVEGQETGLDEEHFGPLQDYGTPNAGATEIRYHDSKTGKWETL